MDYTLKNLSSSDFSQIMDLQYAYQKEYPKAVVVPGEVYLSPALGEGENVICAFSNDGKVQGYTAFNANLAGAPDAPHICWGIVKVDPALSSPRPLQDTLFDRAREKVLELTSLYPGHETRFCFQHHASETDAIEFIKSKGCVYYESTYHMVFDLSNEPVKVPRPDGIKVRDVNMDDIPELQAYVNAKNECFPWRAIDLENWQYFFKTVAGTGGRVIVAFSDEKIAGGILVYKNETDNKILRNSVGETDDVFVSEAWRQRGIASYLLGLGLGYFKELGLDYAHLEVRVQNENALGLYKKMGYFIGDETQLFSLNL